MLLDRFLTQQSEKAAGEVFGCAEISKSLSELEKCLSPCKAMGSGPLSHKAAQPGADEVRGTLLQRIRSVLGVIQE